MPNREKLLNNTSLPDTTRRKRMEGKVQQTAEEWRATFDSITDLVSIHDKDFKIVRVNRAFANAFKMKPQELIGKTCYEVVHETKEPWPSCPHKRVLETKKSATAQFFEPRLGIHLEIDASPIFDDKGEVTGTVHIAKDITQRKRAEETLRESEAKYRGLVSNVKLGVFRSTAGPTGRYLEVNPAMEEITGYSREELLQMNVSALYAHPEERDAFLEEIASAAGKATREVRIRKKDGTERVVSATTVAVRDDAGKIIYFDGIIEDITERKGLEHNLKERIKELQCLYGISRIVERPGTTLDKVYQGVVNLLPASWQYPDITCARITINGKKFETENFRDTKCKQSSAIKVPGERAGVVEVCYLEERPELDEGPFLKEERSLIDAVAERLGKITERKRMEQEIRDKNEQLEAQNEELQVQSEELGAQNEELQVQSEELMAQQQELIEKSQEVERANQLKSEFLAHMSHDLRTPLNVIIGFSELMADEVPGKVNEEQRQCLSDILESSQHLLSLISDVLDLSRIEAGKIELKLSDITLAGVIESLRNEIMPMLTQRKQSLDVNLGKGLPLVHVDKARVRQVLLNLLSNASKFTPDGGKLEVEAVREGDWCQVSVIDNGIGIEKEDQERIFTAFYQGANLEARGKGGVGLGLTIAKQIIEMHQGRIWVESEYEKGSRFIFTLPLASKVSHTREEEMVRSKG